MLKTTHFHLKESQGFHFFFKSQINKKGEKNIIKNLFLSVYITLSCDTENPSRVKKIKRFHQKSRGFVVQELFNAQVENESRCITKERV